MKLIICEMECEKMKSEINQWFRSILDTPNYHVRDFLYTMTSSMDDVNDKKSFVIFVISLKTTRTLKFIWFHPIKASSSIEIEHIVLV